MADPWANLLAFRRAHPGMPRLQSRQAFASGLTFATFTTPPVASAPPLLCVNGGLIYDHSLLWPALSPLAKKRQLILYDQRGRGATDSPPAPQSSRIEHDAADVRALREALGVKEWDVLGHSWGGGIAMLGTERDLAGTRLLVLVDSIGPTGAWMPGLIPSALERLSPARRPALSRLRSSDLGSGDPALHSAFSRALFPAWFADSDMADLVRLPRALSATGAAVAGRLWQAGYDWTPAVRALRRPTLVVHGERDVLPVTVARELASLLPQAELSVIAAAGHMPFLESPDVFFTIVEKFLDNR